MLRVALYVRTGELVEYVIVPKFNPMPEIIVWGTRSFVRDSAGKYFEGMAFPAYSETEMNCQGRAVNPDVIEDY